MPAAEYQQALADAETWRPPMEPTVATPVQVTQREVTSLASSMARLDAGADAGSDIEGPVLLDGEGGYVPFDSRADAAAAAGRAQQRASDAAAAAGTAQQQEARQQPAAAPAAASRPSSTRSSELDPDEAAMRSELKKAGVPKPAAGVLARMNVPLGMLLRKDLA